MKRKYHWLMAAAALMLAAQASAQITLYNGEGFRGATFETRRAVSDFRRVGFNDLASSVIVARGNWQVCDAVEMHGTCVVLRPGSYDSLQRMGLNNSISSVRPVSERGNYGSVTAEPLAAPNYEYRRRPQERTFNARVTSVHAVVGPPEQRCWVEREQVAQSERRGPNVGGAVAGAIIGGILGHQIGSGRGNDVATVGGAVVGGAIGANAGRGRDDGDHGYGRDVRHCETAAQGAPDYWDVTYKYRGVDHRVQMSAPPGDSIPVNRDGEPRD